MFGPATRLIYTEQGVHPDGLDTVEGREEGTRGLLDNLGSFLVDGHCHPTATETDEEPRHLGIPLEPTETGTLVTEYHQDHRSRTLIKLLGLASGIRDPESHYQANMEHTLAELAQAVERPSVPDPG